MFELTFLTAGPDSQTLVVVLYYSVFAAGVRATQSVDAMAVTYMVTTLIWLLIALRFVSRVATCPWDSGCPPSLIQFRSGPSTTFPRVGARLLGRASSGHLADLDCQTNPFRIFCLVPRNPVGFRHFCRNCIACCFSSRTQIVPRFLAAPFGRQGADEAQSLSGGRRSRSGENGMSDPKDKPERQDSLPFPPTPSASIAGRTMQESHYKQRVEPRRLPVDAPNILIVLIDDAGP